MKEIIGYHATAKKNIDSILKNGYEMSNPGENHWLGKGVYFFEDLYYAVQWEIIGVVKEEITNYEYLQEQTGVLISNINIEDYTMLDLSSPIGYDIFDSMLRKIKQLYPNEKYEDIRSKGYRYIINILENLELIEKKKYLSKYDVLCATYPKSIYKKESTGRMGDFIICAQKQVCVKNLCAITQTQICIDDCIKDIFSLIIKNRRENYGKKYRIIK